MLTLEVSFLTNRYDPVPWTPPDGSSRFEWPPAPWRVLRALTYAAEQRAMAEEVWPWLKRLAQPPVYHVPPVSVGFVQTDHRGDPLGFVALQPGRNSVFASWPDLNLHEGEIATLMDLASAVHFLGRSTTAVTMHLRSGLPPDLHLMACGTSPGPHPADRVRLLAAGRETDLRSLHARRPASGLPATATIATYYLPKAAVEGRIGPWSADAPDTRLLRYMLREHTPLPLAHAIAEQARRAAMALYGRRNQGSVSAVLSGKDPVSGTPLTGHQHAYFLPTDDDGDGALDHLSIFAASGIGTRELDALRGLAVLTPAGALTFRLHLQRVAAEGSLLFGPARVWNSHLPFVPVHHSRRGRTITPADQIQLELGRHGFPVPADIRIDAHDDLDLFRWLEGKHLRHGPRYFARIRFSKAVMGPITLGGASHFGMGLFLPAGDDARA